MTRSTWWTLVLGILLTIGAQAGCLGDEAGPAGPAEPSGPGDQPAEALPEQTAPATIAWGLYDCTALVWFVPADAQAVAAQLPEGFQPRGVIGLPAGDPPPGLDGYLGFEAFTCAEGDGLNGTVEPMTYATVFTSVQPPEELAVDGADGQHYYKWHVLVPDAPRRDLLQQAGAPAVEGSVDVSEQAPGLWSATFRLDGLGTFTLEGPVDGEPVPSDASIPFAEFTLADGGFATWRATATDLQRAGGAGTWTVPEGSWMADVLGTRQGVASFDLDVWSFVDATIELP